MKRMPNGLSTGPSFSLNDFQMLHILFVVPQNKRKHKSMQLTVSYRLSSLQRSNNSGVNFNRGFISFSGLVDDIQHLETLLYVHPRVAKTYWECWQWLWLCAGNVTCPHTSTEQPHQQWLQQSLAEKYKVYKKQIPQKYGRDEHTFQQICYNKHMIQPPSVFGVARSKVTCSYNHITYFRETVI